MEDQKAGLPWIHGDHSGPACPKKEMLSLLIYAFVSLLRILFRSIYLILRVSVSPSRIYVHHRGQKRVFLELELLMAVTHHVGAGSCPL